MVRQGQLARVAMTTIDKNSKALIWDWPVRAFHWLLLVCFLGSWITAESGIEWATTHQWFGYTTLGLIVFRVCWGLIGPKFSRFSQFIRGPKAVWTSVSELGQRSPATHLGHSAVGGWATLALITLMTVQATSGLFISDDIFNSGPYNSIVTQEQADTLSWLHHTNFNVLLSFIGLHLFAILWYRLGKNHDLIWPMISGYKPALDEEGVESSLSIRALWTAIGVALLITALLEFAPEPEYFF